MENHLSFPLLTIGKRARIARGVNQREKILEQHFHTVSLSGTPLFRQIHSGTPALEVPYIVCHCQPKRFRSPSPCGFGHKVKSAY